MSIMMLLEGETLSRLDFLMSFIMTLVPFITTLMTILPLQD